MINTLLKFLSITLLLGLFLFPQDSIAQLTGTKNVPGDYPTLAAAIIDLNAVGVGAGGVTINLLTGNPETAPIDGYVIGGTGSLVLTTTSAANPVIIQGNDNTITANSALTVGALNDGIFKLIGADYVTIDGFILSENAANTITTAGTNNMTEWGVALLYVTTTDGAQFNTISNCTIDLDRTYQNTFGIYSNSTHSATAISTSATATGAAGGNSGLVIVSNTITDVNIGIVVVGPTAAVDMNEVLTIGGSLATANTITNYGTTGTFSGYANVSGTVNGILVRNTRNFTISYNSIVSSVGGVTVGTLNGIQIPAFSSTPTGTFTNSINNNSISLQSGVAGGAMLGINNPSGSASPTSTININDNNFSNFGHTVAGTAAITFILNAGVHLYQNISNNTFTNISVNTTGSVTFISNTNTLPASGIKNVNNNSIVTGFSKTGVGGTVTLFVDNGSDPITATNTSNNNNFSNITVTGATTIAGWGNTNGGSPIKYVIGNTFSNWTGGTSAVTGLNVNYDGGTTTVNLNTVSNITNGGAITGIALGSSGAGSTTALQNTIFGLSSTGTGAVYGISVAGGIRNISRNNIYNLENSNAGGLVGGMLVSGATNINLSNNFISDLRAPNLNAANSLFGINISGGTTVGLYYNTIFLNAISIGALFGSSGINASTTPTLDLRNNIVVNLSTPVGATGFTTAYRRSTTTLTSYASASNNNSFYAGAPGTNNLIFYDGTNSDQTIGDYKGRVAPRDAASFSENVPFANSSSAPYDLHLSSITSTQTESGGSPVTTPIAITDDFDGNARNVTTPDVGADEFAGVGLDLSAPIIAYTPIANSSSLSNRTLVANISDASGVPTTAPGYPNLYWKINFAGTYATVTPTSVVGSDYTYDFGAGVIANDTVYYYIVAQDNATVPNVGAFPSGGAGGYTSNPPAASIPPTSPSYYLVTQNGLSGSYTVGLALFNRLSGKNIYFEKSTKKVMVEVPIEDNSTNKTNRVESLSANINAGTTTKLFEVEETSWIPMENGTQFTGDLYLKKTENPLANFPEGTEGVYANLTAAVNDLNLRGVSGATTFLLVDTLYSTETFPLVINVTNTAIPTITNTVTIKPSTGIIAKVSGSAAASPVVRILNDFVSIDGSNSGTATRDLTIENLSTTTPQVVSIASLGTATRTNITIKNSNLINGVNTSSALVLTDNGGTAGYFKNIVIQNNSIQKAYIGAFCNAAVVPGNGSGILFTQNSLNTSGTNAIRYTGIYLQGVDSATVSLNQIANFDGVSGEDDRGVWLATGTRNTIIERNTFNSIKYTGTGGYGAYGLAVSTGTVNANITIKNNMISDLSGDGWNYSSLLGDNTHGMYLFSTQTGINVYYNSIYLNGNTLNQSNALSTGICLGIGTVADLENNVIVNNLGLLAATGFGSTGIFLQSAANQLNLSNYNDLYVAPTGSGVKNVGQIAATGYSTLVDWQTASVQDANSISVLAAFTDSTNLHIPNATVTALESAGTPIAGITTDIDNQTRNASTPDIGADEFNGFNSTNALAGDYFIGVAGSGPGGSDPDFATLKAACDTLNSSNVSANTAFYITSNLVEPTNVSIGINPGTYTITFKPYTGTVDTITFTQLTDNVGVSGGWVFGTPTLAISSTTNYGLVPTNNITIDGSNTVDGTTRDLVIQTAVGVHGNTNPIRIIGDVNNLTLKNAVVQTNQSVSYAVSITNRNFTSVNWTPDNIVVNNCAVTNTFGNAAQGIAISNSGTPTAFPIGVVFSNNDVLARTRGIFLNYAGSTDVFNNKVRVNQTQSGSLSYGIWGLTIGDTSNVTNIYNNQITLLSTANATTGDFGIIGIEAGSRGTYNIYNNMISGFTTTTIAANPNVKLIGIRLQGALVKSNVYHNSIYLPDLTLVPGTGTVLYAGLYIANGTNIVKNNIVHSDEIDFPSYCVYRAGISGTLESDYNDLYVADTTGFVGFWNTDAAKTLANWQTASGLDANSLNVTAPYTSASDLHIPDGTTTALESAGTPVALVTTDIDGQARNLSTPDIGADEFAGLLQINAPTNLTAVADTFAVVLNWTDNSTNELGFYIERKDGDSLSINSFAVIDTVGVDVVAYNDLGRTPNTTYSYRVQAFNLLGVSAYSNVITATTIVPVELTSFSANVGEKEISLIWSTATELNNRGFELERKLDGEWQKVTYIEGKGTTTEKSDYSYSDKFRYDGFQGTLQYRLKQIDFDGTMTYSKAISVEVDFTPKEYTLYQNYPNPFNPSTTIKFALPFDSNVRITIYNLLGEQVAVLFDQVKEVGYHNVNWNASGYASGIYIYSIEAKSLDGLKNFNSVKKMTLIK